MDTHGTTAAATLPAAKPVGSYRPFWVKRFGPAPFLPMSRAEMERLGWDSCAAESWPAS